MKTIRRLLFLLLAGVVALGCFSFSGAAAAEEGSFFPDPLPEYSPISMKYISGGYVAPYREEGRDNTTGLWTVSFLLENYTEDVTTCTLNLSNKAQFVQQGAAFYTRDGTPLPTRVENVSVKSDFEFYLQEAGGSKIKDGVVKFIIPLTATISTRKGKVKVNGGAALGDGETAKCEPGALITLEAVPDNNYKIENWSVTTGAAPVEVTPAGELTATFIMPEAPVTITASFKPIAYEVVVLKSPPPGAAPEEVGTVEITATHDGETGTSGTHVAVWEGDSITLTANPANKPGGRKFYDFNEWKFEGQAPVLKNGGLATDETVSFDMPAGDVRVEAEFKERPSCTMILRFMGSVNGEGSYCSFEARALEDGLTPEQIEALALREDPGTEDKWYTLGSFREDSCVSPAGWKVMVDTLIGGDLANQNAFAGWQIEGLAADEYEEYSADNSGEGYKNVAHYLLFRAPADREIAVTAEYRALRLNYLTVNADNAAGSVSAKINNNPETTVTGGEALEVYEESTVTLTATPKEGRRFQHWEDDSGTLSAEQLTANPLTLTMKRSDMTLTAVFEEAPVTPVTGVTLDQTVLTLTIGDSDTLTATVAPADATNQSLIWTSDNETVATVDTGGVVTGHVCGSAAITVTTADGGFTATCLVTVTEGGSQEDGDVNGDGQVNVLDLILIGQHFGETGTPGWIKEDMKQDGVIDVLDLILVGQRFTG